ncbi:inosine-uridine preferring nucleoside hydrolase, putative [Ixodes scapularis]|uniref:Inosine-uridine preferring nucleoside hydrolase, putative n=1 Tax=Ixodes scapularis TaxID=6945 RepID=B7Q7L0_IXOSC|nr:inosine-uridine preferring nucleoside hydrolase, putative [Ixodes scapularis]|eukprot:XP_002412181.1 inosine-uridine preferring nucleoside hydrolase, putative [Ixodes scapularis]
MRYIMDVDTGVDDAMALMGMLSYSKCVEAITVVAGNTDMENAYNNTMRVLKELGQTQIPVYKGADKPILGQWEPEEDYFGSDNFGNVASKYSIGKNTARDNTFAPLKLIELIRASSNQITLILLAPLTNLAIALLVDSNITRNVNEIFILGGNIEGHGNIRPGSEFNFLVDPEAAQVVLDRVECRVTIVPWEAVLKSTLPWVMNGIYSFRTLHGKKAKFLKALTNHTISCCLGNGKSPGFSLGDFLAVLAVVDPYSVHERLHHRVAVELTGFHTKGMLVHGWTADMLPHVNRTVDIVDWFNARNIEMAFTKTFG